MRCDGRWMDELLLLLLMKYICYGYRWWRFFSENFDRCQIFFVCSFLCSTERNTGEYGNVAEAPVHWTVDRKLAIENFMEIHRNISTTNHFGHRSEAHVTPLSLMLRYQKKIWFCSFTFCCEESLLSAPTLILLMDRFGWIKDPMPFLFFSAFPSGPGA